MAAIGRYRDRRAAVRVAAGLGVWFVYAGAMGYLGVFRNTTSRPPGVAFLPGPVVIFLAFLIWRSRARVASAFPLWLFMAAQSFRIVVELFLHQLWSEGLIPRMLTFEGANVDIYIGASAPLAAWLATRGQAGLKFALAWNVAGLIALANVVVRAVLTTPGPFHLLQTDLPNLMMGTFPFFFVPGFFVPLAVVLHVFGIRGILAQRGSA